MQRTVIVWCALVVVGVLGVARPAVAQPYCALRDPVRKIHELYPDSTRFRSIVRTVDEGARSAVATHLPMELHFNELGRHTLYVAFKDDTPLGLVHVRSEPGRWGLVENAWALDLDLRVVDFRFQRCRDRRRAVVEADAFLDQVRGLGFDELRALLTDDGSSLRPGALDVDADASDLAVSVLRSALKTIVVTREVWAADLDTLRIFRAVGHAYPGAAAVETLDPHYGPELAARLDTLVAGATGTPRAIRSISRVRDADGAIVGFLVASTWSRERTLDLWWSIDPELHIRAVRPDGGWPDDATQQAFSDTLGISVADLDHCASAAQLAGAEALLLTQAHADVD